MEVDVDAEDERVDNDVDEGAEVVAEHVVKPGAQVAEDSDSDCCGTGINELGDDDSQEAVDEGTELEMSRLSKRGQKEVNMDAARSNS